MAETDTRKTLVSTGASRGIGHATVNVFPRRAGASSPVPARPSRRTVHGRLARKTDIKVDLADAEDVDHAVSEIRHRLAVEGGQARPHL